MDFYEDKPLDGETLESWVLDKVEAWRDHYEANYQERFDEYYRLWRGIWAAEDKTRQSERSKIISPALQQAVESSVAEIEEATFGRGRFFDIKDDIVDQDPKDVAFLREKLHEDYERTKVRKAVAECLINSAVFGTGIAEVIVADEKTMAPATQPMMNGDFTAVGVNIVDRVAVKLKPVLPQNFLIDPVATSVEDALGCAVDEFVSRHTVEQLQEQGVYRDTPIEDAADDFEIEPDQLMSMYRDDKIRLTKYYGLVPRHLLEQADEYEEITEVPETYYVEAIVVIANEGTLLKAEFNPYMMQDRPIVAFPWDIVPGRFWGRGVCEKGYNSQKALDAEIRGRIDALGLTVHPMMGIDATRMPRGSRFEVRPGKNILTNGDPSEILKPFTFGQVDQITFAQASALQTMVQQATGAVDSAGLAGSINGEATAAGISMSLGAIIKRHKRTLINFQESFLIPYVYKSAWRYMQFDPEHYPVSDYKFHATSALGIIAREYEVSQLVQLLQTMSPDSPIYSALTESIIDNMNLSNREELIERIQKAQEPNPEDQQKAQEAHEASIAYQQSQTYAMRNDGEASLARAEKDRAEIDMMPRKFEIEKIKAITTNLQKGESDEREFEKRLRVAELRLKEKETDAKVAKLKADVQSQSQSSEAESQLLTRLQGGGGE